MFFLEEVQPRIFCVTFLRSYELCMAFKRFAESYENDDPRWRDFPFRIEDFDQKYSLIGEDWNNTYAEDWAGFNLTGKSVQKTIRKGIPDLNKWDQVLLSIWSICVAEYPDLEFALIGIGRDSEDIALYDHELAHALYETNSQYKDEMDQLFNKLPEEVKDRILQILKSWAYDDFVLVDEVQAYLSTGIEDFDEFQILKQDIDLDKYQKPFIETFTSFAESSFKRRIVYPHLD